jgi:Spy/CpxP family protein refolding chaperone
MVSPRLKTYGIVVGIFVLGAGAGAGAGYAVASKHVAEVLGDERPGANEARRFEGLARELDLSRDQRGKVRDIMDRHRDENRKLTQAMFETCGDDLKGLRARVDGEIEAVLTEQQKPRFRELMEKRKHRFPLGGPGHRRKGEGRRGD